MIILVIYNKLKSFILIILGVFRRALCFRKRSNSSSEKDETLNMIVVNESPNFSKKSDVQLRDWNDWSSAPRSIDEHIEQYREKLVKPPTPPANEDKNLDMLFSELEPTIKKQKRIILVDKNAEPATNFSRLEPKAADIPIIDELQDIEEDDSQNTGWEVNEQATKQLIREKRKEIRAQKNQKQRLNINPGPFAEKVSR